MNDTDIIQTAYGDTLTRLFAVYFDSLANANDNATAIGTALDDFKRGVVLARRARDTAINSVQSTVRSPNIRM